MKIVFAGDYHIGIKPRHSQHKKDIENAINTVEQFCIDNEVDYYICLGDVFHYPSRLSNHDILFAKEHFDHLKENGIKNYILTGNHEAVNPSLLQLMSAEIATRGNSPISVGEISLVAFLFRGDKIPDLNCEIACIHQGVASLKIHRFDYSYLSDEFIFDTINAKRVFGGHLHLKSELMLGDSSIFYPGSISTMSFNDSDLLHGFYYLKDDELKYQKIPVREWKTLNSIPEIIEPNIVYRLELKERDASIHELRELFASQGAELVGIQIEEEEKDSIKEIFIDTQTYFQQFETFMRLQNKEISESLFKKFYEIQKTLEA